MVPTFSFTEPNGRRCFKLHFFLRIKEDIASEKTFFKNSQHFLTKIGRVLKKVLFANVSTEVLRVFFTLAILYSYLIGVLVPENIDSLERGKPSFTRVLPRRTQNPDKYQLWIVLPK